MKLEGLMRTAFIAPIALVQAGASEEANPMILIASCMFLIWNIDFVAGEDICCAEGECYSMDPPWQSFIRPVPPPRCNMNVMYHIYTRSNPSYPYNVTSSNEMLDDNSPFDARKPTIFIFHGWMNSSDMGSMKPLVDAFLQCVDANVIAVNYSSVTKDSYAQAVSDVRVVARDVSKFMKHLVNDKGLSHSKVHLVGVSLGAHTASYVGKLVPGLDKITGLDPAGPMFEEQSCTVRLCKGDAKLVESIHTNANPVWGLGTHQESADISFLLNGGFDQPGCGYKVDNLTWGVIKSGNFNIIQDAPKAAFCSHARALEYYAEAVRNKNCTFWGVKAKFINIFVSRLTKGFAAKYFINPFTCTLLTCVPMGRNRTGRFPSRGFFLVATNPSAPFCVSTPITSAKIQVQEFLLKWVKKAFGWSFK